ncbi:MAG: hypothetical protein CVV63_02125, partial [Tenericutes bacterium HGW-Tenericutes-8]
MSYTVCTVFPNDMLLKSVAPCISIYMPTSRVSVNIKQDMLVFKNLVKEVRSSLERKYANRDIKNMMSQLENLAIDQEFWAYALDGLAVFASLEDMLIYRIETTVEPIAIVASSFHLKPLTQYYQVEETFTILALDAESFSVYEGNQLEIKSIELPKDAKTTLSSVLGTQKTNSFHTHGTYGGASDGSVFHGHGGKSPEMEKDQIKFFKHVDSFILGNISKHAKYPLILVAPKQHHADFKSVSINPYLIDECVEGSYKDLKDNDLKAIISKIMDNRFKETLEKAIGHYQDLRNEDKSTDQLILVLKGLLASRVDTLFIESDKIIPGKIDYSAQQMVLSNIENPETDDLLDDLVTEAFKT